MYIHLGGKKIISDKNYIGIFNSDTLKLSEENIWITNQMNSNDKCIAVDINNNIISSKVSPFTVIKRTSLKKDIIWRRDND